MCFRQWATIPAMLLVMALLPGCLCMSVKVWPPMQVSDCKAYADAVSENGHTQLECYTYLAVKNSDRNICANLEPTLMGVCLRNYAASNKDASICESIPDTAFETDFSALFLSKDLCFLGVSTNNDSHCGKISSEVLKSKCFSMYSVQGCYQVKNLKARSDCFHSVLFSGLIVGLEEYYKLQDCETKISNLVNKYTVYRRDFSNPKAYSELPLDECVISRAVIEEDPAKCELLTLAGKGAIDYCYARVSEYFQMDYCEGLNPSCTYGSMPLRTDIFSMNGDAFGKEYCKALAEKFNDGKERIVQMDDRSFCQPQAGAPNADEQGVVVSGGYDWKKFQHEMPGAARCIDLCDAQPMCSVSPGDTLGYCVKIGSYDGQIINTKGVVCDIKMPVYITENKSMGIYCCCPINPPN